jgi:hypothetical protein
MDKVGRDNVAMVIDFNTQRGETTPDEVAVEALRSMAFTLMGFSTRRDGRTSTRSVVPAGGRSDQRLAAVKATD